VVGTLFFLFTIAFLMRMAMADWRALPLVPWQLWLSSALLAGASIAWRTAGRASSTAALSRGWAAGCVLSLSFLGVQLWAWQAMLAMHLPVDGNPANSFFYLITGLHGVHVLGGLVGAGVLGLRLARGAELARLRSTAALCAQYWHFLLVLWVAMFALLFLVTPDFVQLCTSLLR
jgi:cytochrome c oxidase subunit 3